VITSGTTATTTGAPAAEGDEAQHDHRRVHQQQHLHPGLAHHDVGGGLDAGAAGGQQELAVLGRVRLGELVGDVHHAVQRLGAVVRQVGDHRHHRAVGVEQVGVVHAGLLRAVVQHVLVARDGQPLGAALVAARRDLAHRVGQRHRRLHARHLLQRPGRRSASTRVWYCRQPSLGVLTITAKVSLDRL
jgi:hypothetical protein